MSEQNESPCPYLLVTGVSGVQRYMVERCIFLSGHLSSHVAGLLAREIESPFARGSIGQWVRQETIKP